MGDDPKFYVTGGAGDPETGRCVFQAEQTAGVKTQQTVWSVDASLKFQLLGRLRYKHCKFKASLGHSETVCLKRKVGSGTGDAAQW